MHDDAMMRPGRRVARAAGEVLETEGFDRLPMCNPSARIRERRVGSTPVLPVLLAAAALMAAVDATYGQNSAVQAVNLAANVEAYCTIDGVGASSSRTVTVTTSNGKVATPGPITLTPSTSSKVTCTTNARIQLATTNGGLTSGRPPEDAAYTNKIHYTAKATYAGATETLTTTDATPAGFQTGGTSTVGGAQANLDLDLSVEVIATPAGKVLVHGTYSDTIMVTLSPAT